MCRRESGVVRMDSTTRAIWSIVSPCPAGQLRHCTPYTGPRSPFSSAHSSQMLTPRSCSQRTLEEPERNHSSSSATERKCTRLVVSRGKEELLSLIHI